MLAVFFGICKMCVNLGLLIVEYNSLCPYFVMKTLCICATSLQVLCHARKQELHMYCVNPTGTSQKRNACFCEDHLRLKTGAQLAYKRVAMHMGCAHLV